MPVDAQGTGIMFLEAQPGQPNGPTDLIHIVIPPEIAAERYPNFAVALDNLDVTSFIEWHGSFATLAPPVPLSPGTHSVLIVEYTDAAEPAELARWSFEVGAGPFFEGSALLGLDVAARVGADDFTESVTDDFAASGGASAEAEVRGEAWRVSASADALYNTQRALTITGEPVDLGEYLVDGEAILGNISLGLGLGHQSIGAQSLVMGVRNRRGLSASVGTADGMATLTGFAFRPQSTVGHRNITGIDDTSNRVEGAQLQLSPFSDDPETLTFTAAYLSGEGDTGGFGAAGDEGGPIEGMNPDELFPIRLPTEGDAVSLAVSSVLMDGQLQFYGEGAFTRFNPDTSDTLFDKADDHGYQFLAAYKPINDEYIDGNYEDWTIGVQYERVGTNFESLANPSLVSDRRALMLFTDYTSNEVAASAQFLHQTDNVNDIDLLPTVQSDIGYASLTWQPAPAEADAPWYGQPTWSLQGRVSRQKQIEDSSAEADLMMDGLDFSVDNMVYFVQADAGFQYTDWGWQISHGVTYTDDRSGLAPNSINHFTGLSGNLSLGEYGNGSAYIQTNFFDDHDTGDLTKAFNWGVDLNAILVPDQLTASLNYSSLFNHGPIGDDRQHYVAGDLTWIIAPARANRVGVSVSLNFSWQRNESDFGNITVYQTLGVLSIALPGSYPSP